MQMLGSKNRLLIPVLPPSLSPGPSKPSDTFFNAVFVPWNLAPGRTPIMVVAEWEAGSSEGPPAPAPPLSPHRAPCPGCEELS